jgi:hypothetical protein
MRGQLQLAVEEINCYRQRARRRPAPPPGPHLDHESSQKTDELKQAAEALEMAQNKVTSVENALERKTGEQEKVASSLETSMRRKAEATERKNGLEG